MFNVHQPGEWSRQVLRYLTAGESHGPALIGILEGLPAGVPVTADYIDAELARRQGGYGRGGRMKIERDRVEILAGVRHGYTLGSPVGLLIRNRDWANWEAVMSPHPPAGGTEAEGAVAARVVTRPRPGHADLAGGLKYGHRDLRNVLERASARETAMRVAVGAVCQAFLAALGIRLVGHVLSIGGIRADTEGLPPGEIAERAAASPLYCADTRASEAMAAAIDRARESGDSLGGVVEVIATGVPVGLGSHVSPDRRLDGRLAQALMSIQAFKGVEIGLGFEAARRPGSEVHDEILAAPAGGAGGRWFTRGSNRAGGLEGGITNGEPVVVRAAMKPIATLYTPLRSVDIVTKQEERAGVERSDICAVPAASVVAQAMVAFVLAQAVLEKFGGDSLEEVRRSRDAWEAAVRSF